MAETLSRYQHIDGISEVPALKVPWPEAPEKSEVPKEHLKAAQTAAGELQWLVGRARPDLQYATMAISQLLTTNPLEACRRAEVVIRYLRWSSKVGPKYDRAPNNFGKWEELTRTRDHFMLVSDASLAPAGGRSIGAAQILWAGSLVSWCGGRQRTAEAELLSLTEALARAVEPLIAAFHRFGEVKGSLRKGLCADNTATLQLCQLESGSWRTRHIRLRAAIVREALGNEWRAAHLPGLCTFADVATKAVEPQRLADLMRG